MKKNTQDIVMGMMGDMAELLGKTANADDLGATAIRGQIAALAIACSGKDEKTENDAQDIFSFFTMQVLGLITLHTANGVLQDMFKAPTSLEVLDNEVFETEYERIANSDVLRNMTLDFINDLTKEIAGRVDVFSDKFMVAMVEAAGEVDFPDTIDADDDNADADEEVLHGTACVE